jgi:hypothetical protein
MNSGSKIPLITSLQEMIPTSFPSAVTGTMQGDYSRPKNCRNDGAPFSGNR